MFKAQLTDGEQVECSDYEVGDNGVELRDESGELLAFVPFAHLMYVANVDEDGKVVW